MTNITLYTSTRQCIADNYFLGYEGENNINKLIFKFEDGFRDGLGILNIKREEETGYLDLTKVGDTYELEVKSALLSKIGEITFQFTVNEPDGTVIKYDAFTMVVKDSIDADVEMPEDYPNWIDMANAKLAEVDAAIANTEAAAENATNVADELLRAKENGEFNGQDGQKGEKGTDGFSPSAEVIQTDTGAVITVTDSKGTTSAIINHGQGGTGSGGTGADGFSPIANVTQTGDGAIISITDKTGTTTAVVKNGKDGEKGEQGDTGESGENGKDGLTPHIGDNGNWWIGDADTGIGAGGGSRYEETELLTTTATSSGEYALSTPVSEFDYIQISSYILSADGASKLCKEFRNIPVSDIEYGNNASYTIDNMCVIGTDRHYSINFGFNEQKLLLRDINIGTSWVGRTVGIYSIKGIKLGTVGGSRYKTKELLNVPVEYAFGENAVTNINQDLILNDELSNYDEIAITYDFKLESGGYNHRSEFRILTNNIVYNDSNTQLLNGSRRTIMLDDVEFYYFLGYWFKNVNTLYISFTNTNQTPKNYSVLRIVSIKGIKY